MNQQNSLSGSPSRRAIALLILLALACGLTACGSGQDKPAPSRPAATQPASSQPAASQAAPPATPAGGRTVLAGVGFAPPANWKDLGPTNMRQAQYRLAPVGGDNAAAEVNVFYFGAESGGGVDANLQRWIGQMVLPDGGDPAAAAQRSTFTADGMAGHIVSLEGSYKSGGGPMGGSTTLLPGYRLVGVVLEGPQGSLFFKLTGPVGTAKAMEGELLKMMRAATKAG
jgi:hypothetical protein